MHAAHEQRDASPGEDTGTALDDEAESNHQKSHLSEASTADHHPEPRLAIAKLRLENFKSYGGVVDVGPFHKSFSAVVGPNGSGKSNVIDAMLFVFGRRAKQLRHSKLRELLHHSNTHPNVSSATVTVFFHEIVDTGDGDTDFDIVEGTSFSVARRAFKNDTSKYYLNEKEVKMATVVELLKSKGVDLDNNRFLILQGEVEQIAMMKPKAQTAHEDGLLEYLEDIIGSNRHVEAITESGKEVEALNEERAHKLNRVKAAERERDGLEDAKTEAEDFVDKERSLLTKRLRVISDRIRKRTLCLEQQEQAASTAQVQLDKSKKLLNEYVSEAEILTRDFTAKKKEADSISGQLNVAKEKYAASDKADIQLGTDLKALKSKERKAKATIEREQSRAEKADEDACQHDSDASQAEKEISRLEEGLDVASRELELVHSKVRDMTQPLRSELELKQEELLPLKDCVNSCQRAAEVTRSERDLLLETLNSPISALESANRRLAELEKNVEEARQDQASLGSRQLGSQKQLNILLSSLRSAKERQDRNRSAILVTRRKLEEAKEKSENSASSSRLFSALYSASRDGKLSGIVGRLGDLGTIREEYGIAAGAAAGSTLDNMVVRRADEAQACIAYMRQHNLGRSTFIILEKLSYLHDRMERRDFDGPRLFDHVTVENEQNRVAFYFALRDTLVASNLDDARRMAFKPTRQNRVVTMAGELIESSGAMTGGGRGPPRHRLGSKGRSSPVAEAPDPAAAALLQRSLDEMLRESKEVLHELESLEVEKQNCGVALEQINTCYAKNANIVQSLESQMAEFTTKSLPEAKRAAALAKKILADNRHPEMQRLASLGRLMIERDSALTSAREACKGLESSISDIQSKIVAAGGEKLQNAKAAVDELHAKISAQRSAAAGNRSRANSTRKSANTARKVIEKAEKDIHDILTEREAVFARRASLEDEAAQLAESFKVLESEHDAAVEEVRKISEHHAKVKQELKRCRQAELPLAEAVNDAKRLVAQGKSDLREMLSSVKSLRRQLRDLDQALSDAELANVDEDVDITDSTLSAESQMNIERESEAAEPTDAAEVPVVSRVELETADVHSEVLSSEELAKLEMEISALRAELSSSKPNLGAIAEYRKKSLEYRAQVDELDTISGRRDSARKENDRLRKARLDEFMQGFGLITMKLKELYQMITLGGDAELELVDSLDPFSEGIVFSVRPPKKSWKNISNLSGGEKTLSSLALVFALHHFKPTPLYFLDEIDAALDFKNVSIVANYVKERTKNAQFIIISLRNNMFELADRLVGIYKTHNTTKSVTVNPKAFVIPTSSHPPAREVV